MLATMPLHCSILQSSIQHGRADTRSHPLIRSHPLKPPAALHGDTTQAPHVQSGSIRKQSNMQRSIQLHVLCAAAYPPRRYHPAPVRPALRSGTAQHSTGTHNQRCPMHHLRTHNRHSNVSGPLYYYLPTLPRQTRTSHTREATGETTTRTSHVTPITSRRPTDRSMRTTASSVSCALPRTCR